MNPVIRNALIAAALGGLAAVANAASLSFSGTFTRDDSVALLTFTTTGSGTVTIETYSFAGGVDPSGLSVASGGFDPVFGLFDASGNLLATGDDGAARIDATDYSSAFDALWSGTLAAGTYTVALAQFDNYPLGPLLSSGYLESGRGNFTADYGCSAKIFCDINGTSRTGAWSLAVSGATVAAVPEPETWALMLAGLGTVAGIGRRRRAA